jgi:dTDP-4-dehydrorhamnose reductase
MKIMVLGATGMLGHTLVRDSSRRDNFSVHATVRSREGVNRYFTSEMQERIYAPVDVQRFGTVVHVLEEVRPDVVINCIGVIKQLSSGKDPIACIMINALFPHRLAKECERIGARLIHISTDCVFSGRKGGYVESDFPDCDDLYGRTKLLGEVDSPCAVTLRTSVIGHELYTCISLIDWFLAQEGRVKGYTRAIYTGVPTIEIARIIADYVIPNASLSGIYHVSSEPISKYDLLKLVARQYGKSIEIEPFDDFYCDRSLDSTRFRQATGYIPPSWPQLVNAMWDDCRATSSRHSFSQ